MQMEEDQPAQPNRSSASPSYVLRLLHYLRDSWRIWLIGFVVVGGAAALFWSLASEVLEQETFRWDAPLMLAIHQLSTPWLDQLMITVSWIGSPGAYLITAIAVVWLWRQRQPVAAIALLVSAVGAGLLNTWLKLLFARPRPAIFPPLSNETTYSFPSGHAMGAIGLYGLLAYLLWQQNRRGWAMLSLFFALLIAFSRIYLGVHYPSDILGALAVSVVWLSIVIASYRYYQRRYARIPKSELSSSSPAVRKL